MPWRGFEPLRLATHRPERCLSTNFNTTAKLNILPFNRLLVVKLDMRQSTLMFLLKDNQILLAMKKRGFGIGKWNGVGGKQHENESIDQTAIRETQEEIGITPKNIKQVANLDFFFQDNSDWDQQVIVYTTTEWEGQPTESEEMKPLWFDLDKIPFDQMWADDKFWLPKMLIGKNIIAKFIFNNQSQIIDQTINEI